MCVVSFIGDAWRETAPQRYPWIQPIIKPGAGVPVVPDTATHEEVAALRAEVAELKELLLAAKKFDEQTGQPDCEVDEKVEALKRVAELLGVDLSEVFDS